MSEPCKIHKVFAQSSTSLAVVIPKEFAEQLDLKDGTYVQISIENGRLVIRKVNTHEEVGS